MVEWDCGFTSSSPEYQQMVLNEDFEQFRSEKILKNDKSPEEIQKLSVDEGLSVMDRAALLISTGQDVQRLCVLDQLPALLKTDQMDTLCRVIPKVCTVLPGANHEFQKLASKVFAVIVQQELVSVHIYVTSCLPSVLQQLESRDTTTSNLWLETVLLIIPLLPKEVVKRQILRIAEANGQLSMSVGSRQGTCKLLGAMASKFDSYWVKKELCPLAKSLCLDVDSGVRAIMCQQLNQLIRALGLDIAKSTLFPHLIELTNDEEPCVRSVAIEALVNLVAFLDKTTLTSEVVPMLKKYCEWALGSGEQDTVLSLAKMLGRICHELKDYLGSDQRLWFLDLYRKLTNYTCPEKKLTSAAHTHTPSTFTLTLTDTDEEVESECRRWCAYNLPAMVLFCGKSSFDKELLCPLKRLAESPYATVRRSLACGLHEVVKIVSKCDRLKLAPIYQNLLKDASGEVLHALVSHLQDSLDAFAAASTLSPDTRQPGLLDFISPLQSCEQVASTHRQWRLHQKLILSMECLVACMTSDQLYNKFVPILFKYITGPCVLPVKLAACNTLCIFIRHIRKQELRHELCIRLCEECVQNPSCKQRLLYIEVCGFILDIFSRGFFKEYFFQPLLELANDPIVNVRLHLCRLLPSLKSVLKLPGDRVLLQKLEQTVRKLISQERDPDASQAIRDAVTEMDRIEVAMETLTRRTFFEADLTDQRREEEERALLLWENKEYERQAKKAIGKTGKSPSENRRSSSSSMVTIAGGSSPSPGAKCSNKYSRNSSTGSPKSSLTKSLSVPSPSVPNSEQPPPTNLLVSRKGTAFSSSSPRSSPSSMRKSKGPSTAKGSQTSITPTLSKACVAKSKDLVATKSTKQQKKSQEYALEYSKAKKRAS